MPMPMRMLLVVLAEEVGAIVVAVRGADHGVDVVAGGSFGAAQRDRALVVEFDEDDRALDAIIEDAVRFGGADPAEGRAIEMSADFGHFHASMTAAHAADVFVDEIDELVTLRG